MQSINQSINVKQSVLCKKPAWLRALVSGGALLLCADVTRFTQVIVAVSVTSLVVVGRSATANIVYGCCLGWVFRGFDLRLCGGVGQGMVGVHPRAVGWPWWGGAT